MKCCSTSQDISEHLTCLTFAKHQKRRASTTQKPNQRMRIVRSVRALVQQQRLGCLGPHGAGSFTYICHGNDRHVGKCSIHGAYVWHIWERLNLKQLVLGTQRQIPSFDMYSTGHLLDKLDGLWPQLWNFAKEQRKRQPHQRGGRRACRQFDGTSSASILQSVVHQWGKSLSWWT